jgi:excisionase family DNA binding protein
MESIIQIQNITKKELYEQLELIVEGKFNSLFKTDSNQKLSVQDVANELGVTPLTVHNYIKRGTLPAYKIGRRVYVKRVDLNKALDEVKSLKYKR